MEFERTELAGLTSEDLIQTAEAGAFRLSARMLETFRGQELLPRAVRVKNRGRMPTWVYPAGADGQLLALLRWREHTKDPDLLSVLLWLDGFAVPAARVRRAIVVTLERMLGKIDHEIAVRSERSPLGDEDARREQAITTLSSDLAGKRGKHALPRQGRIGAAQRSQAVELLVRSFMLGQEVTVDPAAAEAVEQVLGVGPNGRRDLVFGEGPWLVGPATDLFDAASFVAPTNAVQSVAEATAGEFEEARALAGTLWRCLPLMARMMGAAYGDPNYAGMAGLRRLDTDLGLAPLLTAMIVGMVRDGKAETLRSVVSSLGAYPEMLEQLERVLDLPSSVVAENLAGEPEGMRLFAERIIAAAANGEFTAGPARG